MQYEHMCTACSHEWEEEYKMSDPIPTKCPKCKKKGKVKRLISSGISGKCPLTGRALTDSLWQEGKKIARDAKKNENIMADIQGSDNYHNMKLNESKLNRDLKGIIK